MSESQTSFKIRLSLKGDLPPSKSKSKTKKNNNNNKNNDLTKKNHVVTITPLMTIKDLMDLSFQIFDVPKPKAAKTKKCQQSPSSSPYIELYAGFPPKLLTLPEHQNEEKQQLQQHLVKSFIRGGDNVIVKFCSSTTSITGKGKGATTAKATGTKVSKKRPLPTTATTDSHNNNDGDVNVNVNGDSKGDTEIASKTDNTSIGGRQKRAAAKAASASFKDVIKEQDKMLKQEQKGSKGSKKRSKNSSSLPSSMNTGGNTNKKRSAAEARAAAANSRRLAKLSGGRRLGDDDMQNDDNDHKNNAASSNRSRNSNMNVIPSKTTKVQNIFEGMKSEDDISFALLSSVNTSGSGRKVSKVLRSAMRRTVEKSYEASRAVVRCSAITSGDITFLSGGNSATSTTSSGGTCNDIGTFTVRYPKSVEGIGYYNDENIHIISIDMLKAVIQSVYASSDQGEIDRDDNDEQGSMDNDTAGREMLRPNNMAQLSPRVFWSLWFHFKDKDNCTSIEEALELLLPSLDWKFLSKRSRQLSQKAKENLRQQQEAKVMGNIVKEKTTTTEEDEEREDQYQSRVMAIKSVEEAMENMYDNNSSVASLRARAAQAAIDRFSKRKQNNDNDEWILETPTELDIDELYECIEEGMDDGESTRKYSPDQMKAGAEFLSSSPNCSIQNWRMLANVDVKDLLPSLCQSSIFSDIEKATVASIITAAQQRSIEEIMLEILDGDENVFHILREDASSATPVDLTLWRLAPSILLEEVPALQCSELKVTEQKIIDWCNRAQIALNTCPWLENFSTSISNNETE